MRLNESFSGFFSRCGSGGSFFDFFGSGLAGNLLFLLGGGTDESDGNVTGALEDRAGGAFGTRLETAKRRTCADDGFLDDEGGRIEGEIVLRVSNCRLEGLPDELCGFLGSEGLNI